MTRRSRVGSRILPFAVPLAVVAVVTLGQVAGVGAMTLPPPMDHVTAHSLVVPPPTNPSVPRVAYTADTDGLLDYPASAVPGLRGRVTPAAIRADTPGPAGFDAPSVPTFGDANASHEGQASVTTVAGNGYYDVAFVSTRDAANGDVYFHEDAVGGPPIRVTCDGATHTHPVVSPDGEDIAFASNRTGTVNPGHSNIWVTGPITTTTTCAEADALAVELPDQSGSNTWPTWVEDGTVPELVYSSTRDNPLGDLYQQIGVAGSFAVSTATRLTDGGGAYGSTQPSVLSTGNSSTGYDLLCTTTKFRSDGSLGEVVGPVAGFPAHASTVDSAWLTDPPQSTEGSYSAGQGEVAFTSTQTNPLGGVEIADRNTPATTGPTPYLFTSDSAADVTDDDDPAAPSSHPAWYGTDILVEARHLQADIDDAQTTDGTDTRAIVHRAVTSPSGTVSVVDAGTPTYSPDGTKIAYSIRNGAPAAGRQIEIAGTDGSGPTPVADGFVADAAIRSTNVTDFDIQPAWSPDGTKIAFVRAEFSYDGASDGLNEVSQSIWVADLVAGTATQLTPGADLTSVYYGHPSWSPDGSHIVVSHSALTADLTAQIFAPDTADKGATITIDASAYNNGPGTATSPTITITAPDGLDLAPTAQCPGTARSVVCTIGNLSIEGSASVSVQATAAEQLTDATVTAQAASATPDPHTANNTATSSFSTLEADLSASVSAPATVDVGTPFAVTANINNAGPDTAEAALIYLTAPTNVSLTPTTDCPGSATEVVCHAGNLAADAAQTFSVNATATGAVTNGTFVGYTTSNTDDPDPSNNSDTTAVSTPTADLQIVSVTQENVTEPPPPGGVSVTHPGVIVVLKNAGPAVAASAALQVATSTESTVDVDNKITPASVCTQSEPAPEATVHCALGDLPSGQTVTVTLDFSVDCTNDSSMSTNYMTTITAATSSNTADPDLANNHMSTAPFTITVQPCTIVKVRRPVHPPPPGLAPGPRLPISPHGVSPAAVQVPVETAGGFVGNAVRELGYPQVVETPQIWVLDATTGTGGPLTDCTGTNCDVLGSDPAWSPDGTQIAFDDGGQLDIASLDTSLASDRSATDVNTLVGFTSYTSGTGGTPTASRATVSAGHDPTWAPGGAEIYFAGQPAGESDDSGIYAIKPDGTGLRTVVQTPEPESEPTVEPSADVAVTLTATPTAVQIGHGSRLDATVTNNGPSSALGVQLTIDVGTGLNRTSVPAGCTAVGATVSCALGTVAKGSSSTFTVQVTGSATGAHTSTATVTTTSVDRAPGNNDDDATIRVTKKPVINPPPPPHRTPKPVKTDIAVTVTLGAPVGYVGGTVPATIKVRNRGAHRATAVHLTTAIGVRLAPIATPTCLQGGTTCELGTVPAGGVRTFHLVLHPQALAPTPGDYTAVVGATVGTTTTDTDPLDDTDTATLQVRQPTLRLLPPIGPPGFVTLVYGQEFPPGAQVSVAWNPGITSYHGPFTVESDGTFEAPMLVVRWDDLGERKAIATSTSTTRRFSPVSADMLVVPSTQEPPDFGGRG